jgi:hypothetical protein
MMQGESGVSGRFACIDGEEFVPRLRKTAQRRQIHKRKKPMMKIIAAAAFVAAPGQLAHAQAIVGAIPEEFRGG